MTNTPDRIHREQADALDRTGRDDLPKNLGLLAECLGLAVARRADRVGHSVGSFLHDLHDRGLALTKLDTAAPSPPAPASTSPFLPPRQE
jgi:hypothetical protein